MIDENPNAENELDASTSSGEGLETVQASSNELTEEQRLSLAARGMGVAPEAQAGAEAILASTPQVAHVPDTPVDDAASSVAPPAVVEVIASAGGDEVASYKGLPVPAGYRCVRGQRLGPDGWHEAEIVLQDREDGSSRELGAEEVKALFHEIAPLPVVGSLEGGGE